jgi:copper transport protein
MTLVARAVFFVLALLQLSGAALAHAVLLHSEPADGAVLAEAPAEVRIAFNEPVSLIAAQLLDGSGAVIATPEAAARDGVVEIALPRSLAEGSYLASYRVVSADGHPIGGSLVFSIGTPTGDPRFADSGMRERLWRLMWIAVRATLNAGLLGSAGGVLFLLFVAGPGPAAERTATIARRLALVALLAAMLSVGIQGALLANVPPQGIFHPSTWLTGIASTFGRAGVIAGAGAALIGWGLSLSSQAGRRIALAGAALALVSYASAGHVVTAGPRWITIPVLLAHTSAVAFWAGSLLPLRAALSLDNAAGIVRRFSRIAVGAVALLLIAGILIAFLQVESLSALVTTAYGWLLLGKLVLVAGLLGLATINKLRLTPALSRGDAGAVPALRRSIAAELTIVASILIVTAALGTTPPPRALASGHAHSPEHHSGQPHHRHELTLEMASADRRASATFASAHSGPNSVEIAISGQSGDIVEVREVTFVASNPAAGVEPIRRAAVSLRPGVWKVNDLLLVPPGTWSIEVEALVSDFEKAMFEGNVELR